MSSDEGTTKPTLETLLERINHVGDTVLTAVNQVQGDVNQLQGNINQVQGNVNQLQSNVNQLRGDVNQLRRDTEQGFRRVERKIALLNTDFLAIRGDQEDLLQRIEEIERKAS